MNSECIIDTRLSIYSKRVRSLKYIRFLLPLYQLSFLHNACSPILIFSFTILSLLQRICAYLFMGRYDPYMLLTPHKDGIVELAIIPRRNILNKQCFHKILHAPSLT